MYTQQPVQKPFNPIKRIRIWYALLLCIMALFLIRLFYLQIIRYDYYRKTALQAQLKEYEIKPARGIIEARDGDGTVPIVLNETLYTAFADPKFIKNPKDSAVALQRIIGGDNNDYAKKMSAPSRYEILGKKLSKDQKQQIDKLNIKGIGTREESYRAYPETDLAAQLLGFVNNDGDGKYGIEQYLNNQLKGKNGQLKAITDAQGVPLAANKDNIIIEPKAGSRVTLTIDVSMQKQLQEILKAGLDKARSGSGSALIIDPYSGDIKAMANYPTYNPAEFYKVQDGNIFNNAVVSAPLEVGSVMKPLTMAAALNWGVVNKNSTYNDPGQWTIDGQTVTNVEKNSAIGTKSLADILQLSLNTGATWLLMQMGGGEINQKARVSWNEYMVNHYNFGKLTGVQQGYEAAGTVPDPVNGFGLNIQYANTAFGQGITTTPLQMGAALSSIINGGNYYKPNLVYKITDSDGKATGTSPKLVNANVVSAETSQSIRDLMQYVVSKNYSVYSMRQPRPEFLIGGKTGTAQIARPGGGYYDDRFNGMFIGFVGGDKAQYVIIVRVNEPKIGGYAGAGAAAPVFGALSEMLINNFSVTPKTN